MFKEDYDSQLDRFKESFLIEAARCGRTEEVSSLIDLNANPNWSPSESEDTPLHAAIRNNHIDVATILIAHGSDVSRKTKGGNTSLHLASITGNEEMVALLLSANSSSSCLGDDNQASQVLTCVNDIGQTPFDLAFENGFFALGQTLQNLSNNTEERNSDLSDIVEDDDEIRNRFLAHSNNVETTNKGPIGDFIEHVDQSSLYCDEDILKAEAWYNQLQKKKHGHDEIIERLQEEITFLRQTETTYREAAKDAEEAILILEAKCKELEIEKNDFYKNIDQCLHQGSLSKMSIDELESIEEKLRVILDLVITAKTNKLSQQAENRSCVICQEEPKTVLLMPCRHLCVCNACSNNHHLQKCPLCRNEITERITVFS